MSYDIWRSGRPQRGVYRSGHPVDPDVYRSYTSQRRSRQERSQVSYREQDWNPGGTMARRQGCTCPVLDNHYGDGVPGPNGPQFWVDPSCPFHSITDEQNPPSPTGPDQS